jgi:hypothetical protein
MCVSTERSSLPPESPAEPAVDEDRRDALRKMGAFAMYTAPALLVMLSSAEAQSGDSLSR